MARGSSFKVGDEVAVTAIVRGRVTPDRISVTIPSYDFPHSVVDSTLKAVIGQHIELIGPVTRIDGDNVTVSLRPLVTVDAEHVRLIESHVAPKRKTPLVDKGSPKMAKLSDGPARVSVIFFGGKWIVQIVEQGQLKKREFELEQDAKDFAESERLRLVSSL